MIRFDQLQYKEAKLKIWNRFHKRNGQNLIRSLPFFRNIILIQVKTFKACLRCIFLVLEDWRVFLCVFLFVCIWTWRQRSTEQKAVCDTVADSSDSSSHVQPHEMNISFAQTEPVFHPNMQTADSLRPDNMHHLPNSSQVADYFLDDFFSWWAPSLSCPSLQTYIFIYIYCKYYSN